MVDSTLSDDEEGMSALDDIEALTIALEVIIAELENAVELTYTVLLASGVPWTQ